ncbi:hypothetical protein [Gemella cuniculi]|uniref:hypothetical protein n=1 Tax=Gemella cuniculi TaxID=150240 RepID=UPI000419C716|nr:hypothetical protein [Gemella cuniculi]
MSFVFFALPISFIIIFVIFLTVVVSDSKKYRRNLDNAKQVELDRAREQALKTVEQIKSKIKFDSVTENIGTNPVTRKTEKLDSEHNTINSRFDTQEEQATVNQYQQYYNKNRSRFKEQYDFQDFQAQENNEKDIPTLVFSKENMVRGLIAKEYLNKREQGNRRRL